jgi:hypothetical protein
MMLPVAYPALVVDRELMGYVWDVVSYGGRIHARGY